MWGRDACGAIGVGRPRLLRAPRVVRSRGAVAQVDALFAAVGAALCELRARTAATVWLSTAGLGVDWLHVRLDARPKYYRHAPYKRA
ncbi:MAG: hypothetical protein KF901_12575 [Myxococcales bacterium]|nr:hypothetical protein [Myxococcales bacterium]